MRDADYPIVTLIYYNEGCLIPLIRALAPDAAIV